MTENLEGLGDALRIVVRPPLPPIPATPRVAVLHSGDSAICQTVRDAGLEVAHDYQPETVDDYLDFDRVPAFDLVVAALTEAPEGRERNLETAYRFLYIRRPASFVLVAPGQEIDGRTRPTRPRQDEADGLPGPGCRRGRPQLHRRDTRRGAAIHLASRHRPKTKTQTISGIKRRGA